MDMDIDMVLNELSLSPPARDKQTARQRMLNLVHTAAELATELQINDDIRVSGGFDETEIAPGYSVYNWLFDKELYPEERQLILTYFTKSFLLGDWEDTEIKDEKSRSFFFYNEEPAEGLGFAFLLRSLALSVRSDPPDPRWESSSITLKHTWIDKEEDSRKSKEVEVFHASKVEHIQELIPWIEERIEELIQTLVRNGNDLWELKEELFPNLEFCEDVRKQLREVHSEKKLKSIITRLSQLQNYCKKWKSGIFYTIEPPRPGDARRDSPETRKNKQLLEMRKFRCPDGEYRTFIWHVSVEGNWRMHFFPYDEKPGRMIIGYIGNHLPTFKAYHH